MTDLLKLIQGRKSVRTYDGRNLSEEHRKQLEAYAAGADNPFGIPVRFVFMDAAEYGLSSPVLHGEQLYVAGIVEKKAYADAAFGYSFEQLVLYAWSLGIGTVWIGGTMKRELFEKSAGLKPGEMMPCISPLGYPAPKRSLKESMMRRGVGADSRLPVEKLFFEHSFETPITASRKEQISDLIEMIRWAPSAVNKQPWRIVCTQDSYHFYEKKNKGFINDNTGDLQKIDVGIALCHFIMGLKEQGKNPETVISDPGIVIPDDMEYIVTVRG